jgi:hypothetical protein
MPMTPLPFVTLAAMVLTPLGPAQQARLAAWLNWGAAYRECYEPAPFGLQIDQVFTARCIEDTLRRWRGGSPEQQAATDALIVATPRLVALLNTPLPQGKKAGAGGKKGPPLDPPAPAAAR